MNIRTTLTLATLILIVVPSVVAGLIAWLSFRSFTPNLVTTACVAITNDSQRERFPGVQREREFVQHLVNSQNPISVVYRR